MPNVARTGSAVYRCIRWLVGRVSDSAERQWLYLVCAQPVEGGSWLQQKEPCWYSWSLLFQEKYMALFVFRDRPNTLLRVHKEICQRTPSMFLLNTDSSGVSDLALPLMPVNLNEFTFWCHSLLSTYAAHTTDVVSSSYFCSTQQKRH